MIKFRQKEFAKIKLNPTRVKRLVVTKAGKFRKKAIQEAEKAALNPGQTTSNTVGYLVENPIAAAGNTASVVGPFVNPAVLGIPVGSGSMALEAAAKRVPIYKRATQWVGNKYKNSKLPRMIESTVNAGVNIAKTIP